jgi:hypothetical protein
LSGEMTARKKPGVGSEIGTAGKWREGNEGRPDFPPALVKWAVFLGCLLFTSASTDAGTIETRIQPPSGYTRLSAPAGTFGSWLRQRPLKDGCPPVYLFDGRRKANQSAHHAVLDVDVGRKDLQQCADAVMRLRAEYLFTSPCRDVISFNFTSGDPARWKDWSEGFRPRIEGNRVSWQKRAPADDGYPGFRSYLETVFVYAGSASLQRELVAVRQPDQIEIGDVFIQGGFPGHAVLVVDVAVDDRGERIFLLAQSYMPAQEIHILKSFEPISPWYTARPGGTLRTPEWGFQYQDLRRFPHADCPPENEESGAVEGE